ncbi:MAG: chromosomal replication initiator protein DnaA [Proteobacteria bacterium]|nr:chromosomal replication initiator protein DnaA [Pseudomonadota bacterium]
MERNADLFNRENLNDFNPNDKSKAAHNTKQNPINLYFLNEKSLEESGLKAEAGEKPGEIFSCSKQDLDDLWREVSSLIASSIDEQLYNAWLKPLAINKLTLPNKADQLAEVELTAPNKFVCTHIENNYLDLIKTSFNKILFANVSIKFVVDANFNNLSESLNKSITSIKASVHTSTQHRAQSKHHNSHLDETNLNPKYNFSNFVVGSCNQFAHAVGLKVAESLGNSYNPLFIYGGVGLGKTHLANAIGNSSKRKNKKVLLVSSETFVSELIASLRSNKMDLFKSKFRSLDLLIVDDIQFIIGKERTQEEFFHTFNELYNKHKQIIITSDKLPQDLIGLEERLQTRFASGLSVDLQAPDFETRVAILSKKAALEGINLPETVASFLADSISTNVRELEGAFNRVAALSSIQNRQIDLGLAQEVIKSITSNIRSKEVNFETIQKAVAEKFSVSLNDLLGKRRTQNIATARHVCMYLCRKLTAHSYPEIGAFFGGRDHSTAIHAHKIIVEKCADDPNFSNELSSLEKKITG